MLYRTEGSRAPVIVKVVGHQHELPTCTRALATPGGLEPTIPTFVASDPDPLEDGVKEYRGKKRRVRDLNPCSRFEGPMS